MLGSTRKMTESTAISSVYPDFVLVMHDMAIAAWVSLLNLSKLHPSILATICFMEAYMYKFSDYLLIPKKWYV